jgi:hypothetical protein
MKDIPTPISDAAESDDYYCSGMVDVDVSRDLEKKLGLAVAALKQSRMEHYSCEDDWYSCPNVKGHGKCDCGAEEHNKIINDALAQIEEKK